VTRDAGNNKEAVTAGTPTITADMSITAEDQQQQRRQQEGHSNSSDARNKFKQQGRVFWEEGWRI
jgi:hypothetical protein